MPEVALSMLDGVFDGQFHISVISKIELLGFSDITENEDLKFKELINAANVLDLEVDIVNKTIKIRKQYKTKLPDAIIAATALINKLTIISRNTKNFKKIEGLDVLNPYSI